MTYRIREVDGADEAAEIALLHEAIFPANSAPLPDTLDGHWWLAWCGGEMGPIGFAGLIPSVMYPNAGYYYRVGVLPLFRGAGLQRRFTRAIEARARRNGWQSIVSDTTGNVPSANNFIRSGYRLFEPETPWAFPESLYWRKKLC